MDATKVRRLGMGVRAEEGSNIVPELALVQLPGSPDAITLRY
jgi:hypothetical protein